MACTPSKDRSAWKSTQSNQSSLSAWRNVGSLATHWAHSEDSDQTGRRPRLIWVFTGRTDHFYTPPLFVWRGIMLYPPNFECPSVRPSIHLSISASFQCSNFSTFWPIFFKLCIDIGIEEEWYGITSGLISFRNNRVMALDLCPKCIFSQYLKNE